MKSLVTLLEGNLDRRWFSWKSYRHSVLVWCLHQMAVILLYLYSVW